MHNKKRELIIEAGHSKLHYWRDLWLYRELFYFLAWRDILVKYKQTVVGLLWALLAPLLTMIIFTIVFSYVAKLPSGGAPYSILVFTALLPWIFFATSITGAGESLITNSSMISKVYFPRLIVPSSAVIVCFVDFIISGFVLVALMLWLGYLPTYRILFLPLFIFMVFLTSIGIGLWLSALNVKYRDFRVITPSIVQFGLFISPVGYSSSMIPEQWRLLYSLNPMVGVIDGFRWSILQDSESLYLPGFMVSLSVTLLVLITGISYFRKTEKTFADVI
jgi:lipopolysaccharide transport system permease protein